MTAEPTLAERLAATLIVARQTGSLRPLFTEPQFRALVAKRRARAHWAAWELARDREGSPATEAGA